MILIVWRRVLGYSIRLVLSACKEERKSSQIIQLHIMKQQIFIYLFNGFSDWEIAYLTPEINKSEKFDLVYFSADGNPVSSSGGMEVRVDRSLSQINIDDVHMLILPGGEAWERGENGAITSFVAELCAKRVAIAAICGATFFLAQLGILDNVKHTSNVLFYLQGVAPNYVGADQYVDSLAVSDGNIITANGIAPIEFAREVFSMLELHSEKDVERWFQLFKSGIWSE